MGIGCVHLSHGDSFRGYEQTQRNCLYHQEIEKLSECQPELGVEDNNKVTLRPEPAGCRFRDTRRAHPAQDLPHRLTSIICSHRLGLARRRIQSRS